MLTLAKRWTAKEVLEVYKHNPSVHPDNLLQAVLQTKPKIYKMNKPELKETAEKLEKLLREVIKLVPPDGTHCFISTDLENNKIKLSNLSFDILTTLSDIHC